MRPTSSHIPSFPGKMSTGTIKHQVKEPNKAHLVDFMRKLTQHIISNKIVQLSVFQSLNSDDLEMLFQSLSDESEILRKTAAKFICYLLHDNDRIQRFLIDRERICCSEGKVLLFLRQFILNQIPKNLPTQRLIQILRIINSLSGEEEQVCPICWTVNLQTKEVRWLYWKDSPEVLDFIDPLEHLFGIIRIPKSPNTRKLINKTTLPIDKTVGKPEYLDRLLKRKSLKDK